ncbi:MAG: FAD-dependent oxidoreductase [Thermomicrobiales bacterium]
MNDARMDVLIIGAGPYGLALAARAARLGIDHAIVGEPMSFWRDHMPAGMFLRSACDWHLDPDDVDTIDAYLEEQGVSPSDVAPLSLRFYLGYADWFQERKAISPLRDRVVRLDHLSDGGFFATLASGSSIAARRVVIALGFGAFDYVPDDLAAMLPAGSYGHTCDVVDFAPLRGKRVLILGGRQSAYEWAALLREAGAASVDLVHRHPAPAFAEADWSWVGPLVDRMNDDPGWFRRSSEADRQSVVGRLFAEGRLKIEPWLQPRIEQEGIRIWPNTRLRACEDRGDHLVVTLDNGERLPVDHTILATGYKVRIERLPLLAAGNILPRLSTSNGFPVLGEQFQTSVPGLFITSMPATQDFGPFFAFTIAARASARVIGDALGAG